MVKLDLPGYQAAIGEGIPELKNRCIELLGEGKNSVACLVDQELVFLFPKTDPYERKLLKQINLLPNLARTLPLPVPDFRYISRNPTSIFPFAFAGYEIIRGKQVVNCSPEVWDAEWWLKPFGEFVTALHRFPVEEAERLGVPGFTMTDWRVGYYNWWQAVVQKAIYPLLTAHEQEVVDEYLEAFFSNPLHFEFEPVLLHADIHLAHVLLDLEQRRINGVIDWGDCKIGDPALDIRNAWEPFYGGKRDPTWHDRRTFYYRMIPLDKIWVGLKNDRPAEVADSIAEFRHKWEL